MTHRAVTCRSWTLDGQQRVVPLAHVVICPQVTVLHIVQRVPMCRVRGTFPLQLEHNHATAAQGKLTKANISHCHLEDKIVIAAQGDKSWLPLCLPPARPGWLPGLQPCRNAILLLHGLSCIRPAITPKLQLHYRVLDRKRSAGGAAQASSLSGHYHKPCRNTQRTKLIGWHLTAPSHYAILPRQHTGASGADAAKGPS